jgi:hypothetical protein
MTNKMNWFSDIYTQPDKKPPSRRELLQRYRTDAHAAIRKKPGVNLFYTDALGDTITVVTRKCDKHQGDWILTSDIRVRFPSMIAAGTTYEQQRNHHNNRDT